MDALKPYLPQSEGLLPYWILLFGLTALGNSIQSYTTLHFTSRLYPGPAPITPYIRPSPSAPKHDLSRSPVTGLSARTFGSWTIVSALVRCYGAYRLHDAAMWQLVFLTYVVAWAHFMSEWFVFRTTCWGLPLFFPVVGSSVTLVWMGCVWGTY